jgi:hypothetical protein
LDSLAEGEQLPWWVLEESRKRGSEWRKWCGTSHRITTTRV